MANKAGHRLIRRDWASTTALAAILVMGWSILTRPIPAQEKPKPVAAKYASDREGESLFRVNCADCHGMDGRGGGHGPDLTSRQAVQGASDAMLVRTILKGVPGTAMPANDLSESETRLVIAYLRNLTAGGHAPVLGDREKGRVIYFGKGNCTSCHMVNGQGGRLGPDLSDVGASRSTAYLTESIREPSKELVEGLEQLYSQFTSPAVYDTVTVETRDGRSFVGVAKDEDNFSIQLLDTNEDLHMFLKKDLKQVTHERKSLMPAYDEPAISKAELQDLLAYLQSLRRSPARAAAAPKGRPAAGPNKY